MVMRQATEQLNSLCQVVLLDKLLKVCHSLTITTDDKVHIFELSKDLWNYADQQVDTFSVS